MSDTNPFEDPFISEQADALRSARAVMGDEPFDPVLEEFFGVKDANGLADELVALRRAEMADPECQDQDNPATRMMQTFKMAEMILGEPLLPPVDDTQE